MSYLSPISSLSAQPIGIAAALGPYTPVQPVAPVAPRNPGGQQQGNPEGRSRFSSSLFLAQLIGQGEDTAATASTSAYVPASGDTTEGSGGQADPQQSQTQQQAPSASRNAALFQVFVNAAVPPSVVSYGVSAYERVQSRGQPAANSNIATPGLPQTRQGSGHIFDLVA